MQSRHLAEVSRITYIFSVVPSRGSNVLMSSNADALAHVVHNVISFHAHQSVLNGKEDPAQTKKGIPQSHLGFGLSKLALTTTRSGKLCALSTLTGDIVWSKLLPVDQLQSHTLFVTRPR